MKQFDGSELLRLTTTALGSLYPMRATFGLACGVVAKVAVHAASKMYPQWVAWSALDEWQIYYFMFVFAVIPFFPIIFFRGGLPEGADQQIAVIRALLDEQQAPKATRAMVWNSVTSRYLAALTPQLNSSPSLKKIFDETMKELPSDQHKPS